jgi:GDPmannose 4,6-dehydratase
VDISKREEVFNLIKSVKPQELYYLAAVHDSSQGAVIADEMELLSRSYQINVLSYAFFLEAVRRYSPRTRVFYASSCLIFGPTKDKRQDEKTPFHPDTIYGITKLDGLFLSRLYRQKYGVFAAAGILYNHESELRTDNFISKKIIKGAADIKKSGRGRIVIGNLRAERDWGDAHDYVAAMTKILRVRTADDFIIATGVSHRVADFARLAFSRLGLDWRDYVVEDKKIITRKTGRLVGDNSKIKRVLGWQPQTSFARMVDNILGHYIKLPK